MEFGARYDEAMRVIAGEYRSRPLVAPHGFATRPTSDRLRETLFNVLAPRVAGCVFADLYAGSGATGIEALSRGAEMAVFVEAAAPALAAIRGNLASLGIETRYAIEPRKVRAWLRSSVESQAPERSGARQAGFGIVFLDPPYELSSEYEGTLALLGGPAQGMLAQEAVVVAEHRRKEPLAEAYGALRRTRVLEQGDAALSFFAWNSAPA